MTPAIRVKNLSKRYVLGGAGGEYRTLRESVMDLAAAPLRKLMRRKTNGHARDILWALRDVNFSVEPGEVLGVIGRNGAGKSTLLKILSRITHPTTGAAEVRGRMGSLLEVGTGFHPELTGRENVYLNGAILGMTRREIARKFDSIVAFADVERFLDTPVKRYSSGMYMRLEFAVASHLEPDVLVVDEVLAVGDAEFQKKCLGKMDEVSRDGRAVLFVSHNMAAVKALCARAILLDHGQIVADGNTDMVVDRYLTAGTTMSSTGVIPEDVPRLCECPGLAQFRSVRLTDPSGTDTNQLYFRQPFRVVLSCEVFRELRDVHFEVSVSTLDGTHVTYSTTLDGGAPPSRLTAGQHEIEVELDPILLPREYTLDIGLHHLDGRSIDFVQRTFDFTVLRVAEASTDHYRWPRTRGFVRAPGRWRCREVADPARKAVRAG